MVMTIFGTDINALAFAGNNYVLVSGRGDTQEKHKQHDLAEKIL